MLPQFSRFLPSLGKCRSFATMATNVPALSSNMLGSRLPSSLSKYRPFSTMPTDEPVPALPALPPVTERRPTAKLALILGNDDYPVGQLPSCVKDAQDMSKALESKGFVVTTVLNGTADKVETALVEIGLRRTPGDLLVFYYSGHGMEYTGRQYMFNLPPKASMEDTILFQMALTAVCLKAKHSTTIFINDACHYAPGLRPPALSKEERQVITDIPPTKSEFLFEFATVPNDVALAGGPNQNSLFTSFLLPELSKDTDVVTMFEEVRRKMKEASAGTQVSWTHSSLTNKVRL